MPQPANKFITGRAFANWNIRDENSHVFINIKMSLKLYLGDTVSS